MNIQLAHLVQPACTVCIRICGMQGNVRYALLTESAKYARNAEVQTLSLSAVKDDTILSNMRYAVQ